MRFLRGGGLDRWDTDSTASCVELVDAGTEMVGDVTNGVDGTPTTGWVLRLMMSLSLMLVWMLMLMRLMMMFKGTLMRIQVDGHGGIV